MSQRSASGSAGPPEGVHARSLGELRCSRCAEEREAGELDRLLWCERCIATVRAQAVRAGWIAGAGLAALLALWIWLVQQPSDLVVGGWIATVIAAFWLGARAAREIAFGVLRYKYRPR